MRSHKWRLLIKLINLGLMGVIVCVSVVFNIVAIRRALSNSTVHFFRFGSVLFSFFQYSKRWKFGIFSSQQSHEQFQLRRTHTLYADRFFLFSANVCASVSSNNKTKSTHFLCMKLGLLVKREFVDFVWTLCCLDFNSLGYRIATECS